jgi:protein-tyrosine-phosphatase
LKRFGTIKKMILFIDTGDNCRGPMAHGYLLKLLEQRGIKHIEIKTAGVMTPTGLLPTPEAVQLLQEEGVDIRRHRSRPLAADMIAKADLVLGMTPFHVQTAFRMTEEARGKTYLLKEYVGREGRNTQIADPMGGTLEIFKKCFAEIRASLQRLVEMEIVKNVPQNSESEHKVIPAAPGEIEQKLRAAAAAEARGEKRPDPNAPAKETHKAEPKAKAQAKPAAKSAKAPARPAAKSAKGSKPAKSSKPSKPAAKPAKAAKPAAKKASAKPAPKKAAKPSGKGAASSKSKRK